MAAGQQQRRLSQGGACVVVRACVQPGRARRRLKIHAACVTARVLADALRAHGSVDGVPVEGGLSEGEAQSLRWECFGAAGM